MSGDAVSPLPRREFLKQFGALSAIALDASAAQSFAGNIVIVLDRNDALASNKPVGWAASELQRALLAKGAESRIVNSAAGAANAQFCVVLGSAGSPGGPEAISIVAGRVNDKPATLVSGSDERGLVYGTLELADRVRLSADVASGLTVSRAVKEQPANQVRSVARAFCSAIEDRSWYYDKNFWRSYLTELATQRFNRFNLTFGIGYDFPRGVTGDYFHFLYPYLFEVPGYRVRVVPLSDSERERNLDALRFIAGETAARGLHFQVGIWTHAYQWTDSPHSDHHIEGLTPENHAAYCRDALALLLKTCPEIQGLTLRVHGESGIPEGSYGFWRTVFAGIERANRPIEIDMHAKGVDTTMIDIAVRTGMPVKLSPKFWAEHMGLAYHQADIRELEVPRPDRMEKGVFNLSNGSRRFLRYGYGDLFAKGRKYDVLFRLWPGTQRTLLWGDPATAAGYGRASHFCGASGLDICEPLFFKGREGSGVSGGRCAYADGSLSPEYDFQKYAYTYRVWGRLLYNPDADPETWRRYLTANFRTAAKPVEIAVAQGSRILPLLTTAHLPSASNHAFWPEIYTNMAIVLGSESSPYSDSPSPKRFGTVSPLDPELFASIEEYVSDILSGRQSRKYSPIEVAHLLEECATRSAEALRAACQSTSSTALPEFRRMQEDVQIQHGLGLFFASKLRSGVLFEVFLKTGDAEAGEKALLAYRQARKEWAVMALRAQSIYRTDISYGSTAYRRGHWMDRLPAIDTDIAAMEVAVKMPSERLTAKPVNVAEAMRPAVRQPVQCTYAPPRVFSPGKPLLLAVSLAQASSSVRLHYRHVNHAERWRSIDMEGADGTYHAAIPGEYTASAYHLQYYFEVTQRNGGVTMYPGLNDDLSNQPYFVVMQT